MELSEKRPNYTDKYIEEVPQRSVVAIHLKKTGYMNCNDLTC